MFWVFLHSLSFCFKFNAETIEQIKRAAARNGITESSRTQHSNALLSKDEFYARMNSTRRCEYLTELLNSAEQHG